MSKMMCVYKTKDHIKLKVRGRWFFRQILWIKEGCGRVPGSNQGGRCQGMDGTVKGQAEGSRESPLHYQGPQGSLVGIVENKDHDSVQMIIKKKKRQNHDSHTDLKAIICQVFLTYH